MDQWSVSYYLPPPSPPLLHLSPTPFPSTCPNIPLLSPFLLHPHSPPPPPLLSSPPLHPSLTSFNHVRSSPHWPAILPFAFDLPARSILRSNQASVDQSSVAEKSPLKLLCSFCPLLLGRRSLRELLIRVIYQYVASGLWLLNEIFGGLFADFNMEKVIVRRGGICQYLSLFCETCLQLVTW